MGSMNGVFRSRWVMGLSLCLSVVLSACSQQEAEVAAAPEKPKKATRMLAFEAPPPREIRLTGLTEEQKASLVNRVEEKWRAMEQRDFDTVYEYTTPNYRKIFSKSMFLNKFGPGMRWELTGIDVLNYDADAAVASVGAGVMTQSTINTSLASESGLVSDTVNEQWFLIDGEWWNNAK